MRVKFYLIFTGLFFPHIVKAQSVITPAAKDAKNANGEISYSLGQIITFSTNSINDGVHQPYELYNSEQNNVLNNLGVQKITVYPNPVSSKLRVEFESEYSGNIQFELDDINGKIVLQGNFAEQINEIKMGDLASSSYILRLFDDQGRFYNLKIQKK